MGENDRARRRVGRWAGFFYLAFMATDIFAIYLERRPVVWSDAAATAHAIKAGEFLFRLGFASEIVAVALFFLAAWALYVLLSPAGKNTALLFLVLNAIGVAEQSQSAVVQFAALPLAQGMGYLSAFSSPQAQALAMMFLHLKGPAYAVSNVMLAAWLFPLGWLILKSGILPKFLGVLLLLDGVSLLVWLLQQILLPGYDKFTSPLFAVMFAAELTLALWLLIFGARPGDRVRAETAEISL